MIFARIIFWGSLFLAVYSYLLYPVLLFCLFVLAQVRRDWRYLWSRRSVRADEPADRSLPPVTMIIPAFNEQERLREKLQNLKEVDYPANRLEVIFISDGSTDETNEILLGEPGIAPVTFAERRGKANALNEGVRRSRNEILVFSDASTLFARDAVKKLVRHFENREVGVVCGSLSFRGSRESRQTEGVYWRFESAMRLMEGRLGATLTASGAMYALRKSCYRPITSATLIEDFVIPMRARKQGFRVVYDPEAVATEYAASTVEGEFARRVRLAVGSFHALGELFRVRMDAATLLAFLSHKVLRWVVPFLLIVLAASNLLLISHDWYRAFFIAQLCFYLWALAGFFLRRQNRARAIFSFGYYLVAMQAAFLVGFVRCISGRSDSIWQRVN